jgi:DNA-binding MarR family transcriptional regulator
MTFINYDTSAIGIGEVTMAKSASGFVTAPKAILETIRPEKRRKLHEKQIGILEVFNAHIGDDRNWLTATQIRVLHTFFAKFAMNAGAGIDMTEIPYELDLKSATVNRIVQTFSGNESMGKSIKWFRSIRNPNDNRKTILLLTPEGVHVMNDLLLAMESEVSAWKNQNVEAYKNAEATVAKAMFGEGKFGMGAYGEGQVGDVVVETDDGPTPVELKSGPATNSILEKITHRLDAKLKNDQWKISDEGVLWYEQRKQQRLKSKSLLNSNKPILTRNGEEIKPPVSFFELNMDDDECRAFGRTMVRALDEQVDTVAKEAMITRAMEALTLREWNMVKGQLREHNDTKNRIRNWLDSEHERIVSQAATIQSPSERQEFIAAAYAERKSAEGQQEAQIRDKWEQAAGEKQAAKQNMEQLREQIAGELRVTLREEVREEVRQELLQQLLKGES